MFGTAREAQDGLVPRWLFHAGFHAGEVALVRNSSFVLVIWGLPALLIHLIQ